MMGIFSRRSWVLRSGPCTARTRWDRPCSLARRPDSWKQDGRKWSGVKGARSASRSDAAGALDAVERAHTIPRQDDGQRR